MGMKATAAMFAISCFTFTLPAVAQLDSSALRARYGSPLHREIFRIPAGFDLIADYGAGELVCKLEVPALMPTHENPQNADVMRQRMRDFLAELVPASMRGIEVSRGMLALGALSLSFINYDRVTVTESFHGNGAFDGRDTITITFKGVDCEQPR
jgi:hypothetical protein